MSPLRAWTSRSARRAVHCPPCIHVWGKSAAVGSEPLPLQSTANASEIFSQRHRCSSALPTQESHRRSVTSDITPSWTYHTPPAWRLEAAIARTVWYAPIIPDGGYEPPASTTSLSLDTSEDFSPNNNHSYQLSIGSIIGSLASDQRPRYKIFILFLFDCQWTEHCYRKWETWHTTFYSLTNILLFLRGI